MFNGNLIPKGISFPWLFQRYFCTKYRNGFFSFHSSLHSSVPNTTLVFCLANPSYVYFNGGSITELGFHLASRCTLCDSAIEDLCHFLWKYVIVRQWWCSLLGRVTFDHFSDGLMETFWELWSQGGRWTRRRRNVWTALPHVVQWTLWIERNYQIFQGKGLAPKDIQDNIISSILEWYPAVGAFVVSEMFIWYWL